MRKRRDLIQRAFRLDRNDPDQAALLDRLNELADDGKAQEWIVLSLLSAMRSAAQLRSELSSEPSAAALVRSVRAQRLSALQPSYEDLVDEA